MRLSLIILFTGFCFILACGESGSSDTDAAIDADTIASEEDGVTQDIDNMPKTLVIAKEGAPVLIAGEGSHFAFPDVVRRTDGTLFVAYRFGSNHAANDGMLMYQTGSADGITWSDPQVLVNDKNCDDRDPSLTMLSNGTIALNWFKYCFSPDVKVKPHAHHVFAAFSNNGGINFSEPAQIDPGVLDYQDALIDEAGLWRDDSGNEVVIRACSSPMIENGNELLLPLYGKYALNYNNFTLTPKGPLTMWRSQDSGATWSSEEIVTGNGENLWLMEPAIIKVSDTDMLMHVRSAKGASPSNAGAMLETVSRDGGKTWSQYKEFQFVGHAPELIRLSNGFIISAFRWLNSGYTSEKISLIYSADNGASWSDVVDLYDCGAAECGYPGIVELPGNQIFIVYYLPGGTGIEGQRYLFSAE